MTMLTNPTTSEVQSPGGCQPAGTSASSGVFHNQFRGRFNAWFFQALDRYIGYAARAHKQIAFGEIERGSILEIGAGVGANFDYLPHGSRLVAVEPNLAMHPRLIDRAKAGSIELELLSVGAERLPLPDASVDDVLCSLVLCTVADPGAVLAEAVRVLRPGGRFRFVEHVGAPAWSPRRWLQVILRRPWQWVFEGCDTCRDTASLIESAAFSEVMIVRRRFRRSVFVPVNTTIHGIATK